MQWNDPSVIFFLIVALLLWWLAASFEGSHLRTAWTFLTRPENPEDRNGRRELLLERIGLALSAARLTRLLAVMILAVTVISFFTLNRGHLPAAGDDPSLSLELLYLLGVAVVFVVLFSLVDTLYRKDFYTPRWSAKSRRSGWLVESAKPVPAPAAAAAIMWDWFFRGSEWISRKFGLARQMAYLFERDDELLMAIGETEVAAFGARTRDEQKVASSTERTELEMVRAIQRLDETLVREVMRPLNKITPVNLSTTTPMRFLALARRTGYTRFPCYYDQVTNLTGYLNIHDILEAPQLPQDLRNLVHEAPFIPEVAHLDIVLAEMLRKRSQIAICFDEFGGCSGLLSREDIIEEITGEIMDEYDRTVEIKYEQRRSGDYLVDASIDLDDLSEELGLSLEKRNCDTLSGYIYHRLSRVPRRGEILEENGWLLEIVHMDKHRIQRVRVVPPPEDQFREED